MSKLVIKKAKGAKDIPYDLLLLADPSIDTLRDYIGRGECYLAYIEDVVVAAYILIKTRPLTLELVNIAVKEAFQKRGIGKKLVLDSISKARLLGGKILEVGTGNSSIEQLALYQKCGFRIKNIDHNFFLKHYDEKIIENGINCVDMIRLSIDLKLDNYEMGDNI